MSGCASVCSYGVNTFKTLRLRDRWADVDETWHVYSMGLWTQIRREILNLGPCATRATANLTRSRKR